MDAQPGAGPGAPLTVALRHPPGALVVRPEGELDHDSVGPLRETLERAVADPPARLVVDCGGLEFCDSTGLNLLLRAHAAALHAGLPLLLAAPGAVVARMLAITGADEVLDVHPTVEDALAASVTGTASGAGYGASDGTGDGAGYGAGDGAGTDGSVPGAATGPPTGPLDDSIGAP
ncbi:STAS domain-containing protein [Kitasatospora phosalacinea]|uniref:Anti-sigma factor antagonist n=1 Tax=Kitasatospora phosalacinea TaxID=2065 RepID=A0ABW6GMN4_9ACTN